MGEVLEKVLFKKDKYLTQNKIIIQEQLQLVRIVAKQKQTCTLTK